MFRVSQKSRTVKTSFYMKKDIVAVHVDSGIRLNKDIYSSYDRHYPRTGEDELSGRGKHLYSMHIVGLGITAMHMKSVHV